MKRAFQSLYIHVPFCHGKCGYCAFYSLGKFSDDEIERYLVRIEEEFKEFSPRAGILKSVFVGGGTPSVLFEGQLARLYGLVRQYFRLGDDCEWSMEANPESLTFGKLKTAMEFGVNRLSIGIQSFNEKKRNFLMRNGDINDIQKIVQNVEKCGLKNLNFDLIYAVPGETPEDWEKDLKKACQFAPQHISAYSLIIEEKTPLAKLCASTEDDRMFRRFWRTSDKILGEAGLKRYEISNFCQDGHACRHNDDVWHGETYLGCGPAAVSFDGEDRPANPSNFKEWLSGAPKLHDSLEAPARAAELLAFGMRTIIGWNIKDFQALTGFDPMELRGDEIRRLVSLKMLSRSSSRLRPTKRGLLYNDDLLETLI